MDRIMTLRKVCEKVLIMIFMSCVAAGGLTAQLYMPADRVVFSRSEMSAKDAFTEIRNQTRYRVAYSNNLFDDRTPVVFTKKEHTLAAAMTEILTGTGFEYSVQGNIISLFPAPREEAEKVDRAAAEKQPRTRIPASVPVIGEGYYRSRVDYDGSLTRHRKTQTAQPAVSVDIPADTAQAEVAAIRPARDYSSYLIPVNRYMPEKRPSVALKTNLLYGAVALAPNLAVEVGIGNRWTTEFSASVNAWEHDGSAGGNKKLMHSILRQEFRWWSCERFNGHFFGVNAFFSKYNIGEHDIPGLFNKEYRYYGHALGGGVTYGYHKMLNRHWGVELNVGIGVAWLNYKRYACTWCAPDYRRMDDTYFGLTRAGVTLVYIIK